MRKRTPSALKSVESGPRSRLLKAPSEEAVCQQIDKYGIYSTCGEISFPDWGEGSGGGTGETGKDPWGNWNRAGKAVGRESPILRFSCCRIKFNERKNERRGKKEQTLSLPQFPPETIKTFLLFLNVWKMN